MNLVVIFGHSTKKYQHTNFDELIEDHGPTLGATVGAAEVFEPNPPSLGSGATALGASLEPHASARGKFQAVMVLGALVWGDKPIHMLEDRLLVGISVYESGVVPKILLSGDHHTPGYNEVQVMKNYVLQAGITPDDIFMDHAGLSTYESMIRAKQVFGIERMIVVTQGFHLDRALWLAKRVGINAVGVSSDLRPYSTIKRSQVREVAARCKDFFTGMLLPNSYIGGEPIDISGSGLVTQD